MEPTTKTIEARRDAAPALWPIILQAVVGAIIVGDQVTSHWGTWDLFGKFMGIAIPVILSNLAVSGYSLVWVAAVVFNHHSH